MFQQNKYFLLKCTYLSMFNDLIDLMIIDLVTVGPSNTNCVTCNLFYLLYKPPKLTKLTRHSVNRNIFR